MPFLLFPNLPSSQITSNTIESPTAISVPFPQFLVRLRERDRRAWAEGVRRFRSALVPFLKKRTSGFPRNTLATREEFVEEVIEETLEKFFELLPTGEFGSYADLEATLITVAKYKLHEGFARLRRDRARYAPDQRPDDRPDPTTVGDDPQDHRLPAVQRALAELPAADRSLLLRYFNGEELREIATDLNIEAATARKRKQRLVERLRRLLQLLTWLIPLAP